MHKARRTSSSRMPWDERHISSRVFQSASQPEGVERSTNHRLASHRRTTLQHSVYDSVGLCLRMSIVFAQPCNFGIAISRGSSDGQRRKLLKRGASDVRREPGRRFSTIDHSWQGDRRNLRFHDWNGACQEIDTEVFLRCRWRRSSGVVTSESCPDSGAPPGLG